ncbi:hypothetical protein F0P94_00975 [Adhaeribacter soli]|uniref:Uncharacterized protein n=2 Tax=Adhaeribacter soli TaxID=2607655 RepID=A0A5N1J656_9BACT|nr:hypothetical protein F0P94_00975 [Adhaeribacter soli]
MNENKLKHLEFIQNVITRMNSNSFMIKGWTITLVAALFALAAKDANINYVLISYIVIPAFWILDGFFISIEKQYRELYKEVAAKNINNIDFSMDASNYNDEDRTWLRGLVSKTILPFYGISLVTTLFVMWLL